MTTTARPQLLNALPPEGRARLMRLATQVEFPAGTRIFDEGRRADRFWIVRSGSAALDMHVPGRSAAVVETVGADDLLGWSWMFPPYLWQLGATAASPVRALEFEAAEVRKLCEEEDPALGCVLYRRLAWIIARRLHAARTRLLDLYGPQGSAAGM